MRTKLLPKGGIYMYEVNFGYRSKMGGYVYDTDV
jgi:hypothetical protein